MEGVSEEMEGGFQKGECSEAKFMNVQFLGMNLKVLSLEVS
jgi:hypothetical protein